VKLFCIGLSHHTAQIETRERFAGHSRSEAMLRERGCRELVLLTTCNRVEVYGCAEENLETEDVADCLRVNRQLTAEAELRSFYRHQDRDCARQFFRVTSGLDSMVVGETEILGQTKRAYEMARARGHTGPVLHRLCQRGFRVAKEVRTATEITRGSVSVGSVAVDLAEKIFGDLRGRKVLVLGAGETSEKTLRALSSRGVSDLRVSNRSPQRAEELARALEGVAVPFALWFDQCREIDILISSTSSGRQLLTPALIAPMLRERADRPLFVIDIAVPRNVAPALNDMDGVYLYDIDSLQSIADERMEMRRQQFAAAEEIIAQHVARFWEQIGNSLGDDFTTQRSGTSAIAPALSPSESQAS
jgi:glutamyl-tRNA reductase